MNLKDLAIDWLKRNGYDGLYSDGGSCGCVLDDLMPCCGPSEDCHAGYRVPCVPETCEAYGDCEWHIAGERVPTGSEVDGE